MSLDGYGVEVAPFFVSKGNLSFVIQQASPSRRSSWANPRQTSCSLSNYPKGVTLRLICTFVYAFVKKSEDVAPRSKCSNRPCGISAASIQPLSKAFSSVLSLLPQNQEGKAEGKKGRRRGIVREWKQGERLKRMRAEGETTAQRFWAGGSTF